MFALLQLKNIKDKTTIKSKLEDYEFIGFFNSLNEIDLAYKNYYSHKYRMKDCGWCYSVRKTNEFNKDTDSHLLADRIIFDLDFEFKEFKDYQTGKLENQKLIKEILRDIKLQMIL